MARHSTLHTSQYTSPGKKPAPPPSRNILFNFGLHLVMMKRAALNLGRKGPQEKRQCWDVFLSTSPDTVCASPPRCSLSSLGRRRPEHNPPTTRLAALTCTATRCPQAL